MTDITKCHGRDCPIREHCLRYTLPGSQFQSWAEFEYTKDGCEYFKEKRE